MGVLGATITAIIIRKIAGLDIFSTVLILLVLIVIPVIILVFTNNKWVAMINNNILYRYQQRISQEISNEK